jgi:hypothetical protein
MVIFIDIIKSEEIACSVQDIDHAYGWIIWVETIALKQESFEGQKNILSALGRGKLLKRYGKWNILLLKTWILS